MDTTTGMVEALRGLVVGSAPFLVPDSTNLHGRQHQKEAHQDDRCHHIHGRFAEGIVHTIDQNAAMKLK
jgi:hypothetical protein